MKHQIKIEELQDWRIEGMAASEIQNGEVKVLWATFIPVTREWSYKVVYNGKTLLETPTFSQAIEKYNSI